MRKVLPLILSVMLVFAALFGQTAVCFAEPNTTVTIVSPAANSTAYSSSLLVSVKLTKPQTVHITVYQKQLSGVPVSAADYTAAVKAGKSSQITNKTIMTTQEFISDSNLSFYTKKLEKITPGVYLARVETINEDGTVAFTNESLVYVKDKEEAKQFDGQSAGATQFLQNLLKNIFGS